MLLQPTELSVLSLLDLDDTIIARGSPIHQLVGKDAGSRFTTLDVKYKVCTPTLFGVGTHRGALFSALNQKAMDAGVAIISSSEITTIQQRHDKTMLFDREGNKRGEYDFVIDASGQGSVLRERYADRNYRSG